MLKESNHRVKVGVPLFSDILIRWAKLDNHIFLLLQWDCSFMEVIRCSLTGRLPWIGTDSLMSTTHTVSICKCDLIQSPLWNLCCWWHFEKSFFCLFVCLLLIFVQTSPGFTWDRVNYLLSNWYYCVVLILFSVRIM